MSTTEVVPFSASDLLSPEIWRPDQSDEQPNPLIGQLAAYETRPTRFGDRLIALIVEHDTERVWSIMLAGASLTRQFEAQRPGPGERVRLEYRGEKTVQNGSFAGKTYRAYRLSVHRPDSQPDWDALARGEVKLVRPGAMVVDATVVEDVPVDTTGLPAVVDDDDEEIPF